jgi:predicted DNA-binding transcriptional regulator AlpA
MKSESRLLRLTEAAAMLGIKDDTLRGWTKRIPGFPQRRNFNGRLYFLASEIEEWLARQRQQEGAPHGA